MINLLETRFIKIKSNLKIKLHFSFSTGLTAAETGLEDQCGMVVVA